MRMLLLAVLMTTVPMVASSVSPKRAAPTPHATEQLELLYPFNMHAGPDELSISSHTGVGSQRIDGIPNAEGVRESATVSITHRTVTAGSKMT